MLRRRGRRKSNTGWMILLILILGAIVAGGVYLYTAEDFERVPPTIKTPEYAYWNAKDPLKIELSDNVALKSYQVFLNDGKNEVLVAGEEYMTPTGQKTVSVLYPKGSKLDRHAKNLQLKIKATDTSKWNYLSGNNTEKVIDFKIDYRRPNVNILSNSYSITQGGSALVIFQASDDDALAKLYVEAAGHHYKAQPYKKEGYYAALIAWPFTQDSFQAKVVAKDKAGNKRATVIPFYLKNKKYRVSWIRVSDKFIDGKITDLAEQDPKYMKEDRLERFRAINETMRIENEKLIHKYASKVSDEMLEGWKIHKFYPLKNGKKVASFGDERHYYYKNKENEVSQSYHLGYDMASTQMAPIFTSNDGVVVFAEYNGIYGNMPMIDHGLGLYSLYGHCSTLNVKEGDEIHTGQMIAKTGSTGLALGDHLHFGVLVQGVEVRPVEWLDSKWIKDNIEKIFKDADKIIFNTGKSSSQKSKKAAE